MIHRKVDATQVEIDDRSPLVGNRIRLIAS
jgi:hypothetical protein